MQNAEISKIFREIADLLERKKENIFKIRAYRKVADAIDGLEEAVEKMVAEGRIKEIPGAGEAITKKINELVTTGKLSYYERLKAEFAGEKQTAERQGIP